MGTAFLVAHETDFAHAESGVFACDTINEQTEATSQCTGSDDFDLDALDHNRGIDYPLDIPPVSDPLPPSPPGPLRPKPSTWEQVKEFILLYLIEHKMIWVVQEPARHFEEHGSRYQVGGTILSSAAVGALITYLIMKKK